MHLYQVLPRPAGTFKSERVPHRPALMVGPYVSKRKVPPLFSIVLLSYKANAHIPSVQKMKEITSYKVTALPYDHTPKNKEKHKINNCPNLLCFLVFFHFLLLI